MDKYNADISLRNATYSPKKLLLIHSGALIGFSLVLSLISYLLNYAIQPSGGLSSMGLQATLSTAQSGLQLVQMLVTPFWAAGLSFVAIGIVRGQTVSPRDLTAGFQKIGPITSSTLMIGLQYLWRVFLGSLLSTQILMLTPVGNTLYEASAKMQESTTDLDMQTLLGDDFIIYFSVTALVMLALVVPVFYRYRMTTYLIMDGQEATGSRAMFHSRIMMFRRRWELAKLDLSYWWYYLLLMLSATLSMGDIILNLAGIRLPFSGTVSYWLFLGLGLGAQLLVNVLAGPKVTVAYAHCYERFLNGEVVVETASPAQPPQMNTPFGY